MKTGRMEPGAGVGRGRKIGGIVGIFWGLLALQSIAQQQPPKSEIMREIVDPSNGYHWLLLRDEAHPGGPGRLLLAANAGFQGPHEQNPIGDAPNPPAPILAPRRAVIRSGDRLIVEEHTAMVNARLEAVALGTARAGERIRVRLKIGSKVLGAVVDGPGRATLEVGP